MEGQPPKGIKRFIGGGTAVRGAITVTITVTLTVIVTVTLTVTVNLTVTRCTHLASRKVEDGDVHVALQCSAKMGSAETRRERRKMKRNGMNGTHGDSMSWTAGLGTLGVSAAADTGFRPRSRSQPHSRRSGEGKERRAAAVGIRRRQA